MYCIVLKRSKKILVWGSENKIPIYVLMILIGITIKKYLEKYFFKITL